MRTTAPSGYVSRKRGGELLNFRPKTRPSRFSTALASAIEFRSHRVISASLPPKRKQQSSIRGGHCSAASIGIHQIDRAGRHGSAHESFPRRQRLTDG